MTATERKPDTRKPALELWRERQAEQARISPPCSHCGRVLLTIRESDSGEKYGLPDVASLTFGADEEGAILLRGRCKGCGRLQEINPAQVLKAAA